MGKEIRRIYEDWLDDLGLDLKNQQSASRKVMTGVDNDYVKHQFSEYSHTLKIDLRVSGISDDKRDELILPLKKWFDFLDDMLESFQLFD